MCLYLRARGALGVVLPACRNRQDSKMDELSSYDAETRASTKTETSTIATIGTCTIVVAERAGARQTVMNINIILKALTWVVGVLTAPLRVLGWVDRRLTPARDVLERSALAHLVVILAGAFTVYQLWVDLDDRQAERINRREERIERAWNRLITPAGGNTGKGLALGLLLDEKQDLVSVDFSCHAIGVWNEETGKCERRPIFTDVKVPADFQLGPLFFDGALNSHLDFGKFYYFFRDPTVSKVADKAPDSFNDVVFKRSDFSDASIDLAKFGGAEFAETILARVHLSGESSGIAIWNSDLSGSLIISRQSPIRIEASNLSGAMMREELFAAIMNQDTSFWDWNWAWADMPPMRYREMNDEVFIEPPPLIQLDRMILCDPDYRVPSKDAPAIAFISAMGYSPIPTADGIEPRLREGDFLPGPARASCVHLSPAAARSRFPDRYPTSD